jgi:hypothetical protein
VPFLRCFVQISRLCHDLINLTIFSEDSLFPRTQNVKIFPCWVRREGKRNTKAKVTGIERARKRVQQKSRWQGKLWGSVQRASLWQKVPNSFWQGQCQSENVTMAWDRGRGMFFFHVTFAYSAPKSEETHCVSITKTNRLIPFREAFLLCSENHMKLIVACRSVAGQWPRNKQLFNSRW